MSTSNITTSFSGQDKLPSIARLRIRRELAEITTNSTHSSIIFVSEIDDNFLHLEAAISGPTSTPYENGVFLLDIKLPEQYPV